MSVRRRRSHDGVAATASRPAPYSPRAWPNGSAASLLPAHTVIDAVPLPADAQPTRGQLTQREKAASHARREFAHAATTQTDAAPHAAKRWPMNS